MTNFVGKYVYDHSEGLEEYLSKVGGTKEVEAAKVIGSSKPVFEITLNGEEYTVTVSNEGKSITNKFFLNTHFDEMMPHGVTFKTIVTKEDNKFTFVSDLKNGNKSVRVYEFTDAGITVHLSDQTHGVKATRWYKRF